jgi:hypothetical protein
MMPLVGRLLDLQRRHVFGRFEIEARLPIHPETQRGLITGRAASACNISE